MKILFVGDIVGSVGRKMVAEHVLKLKKQYNVDFVIANGENSAHGKGITYKIYNQLLNYGVDMITMGNHTYSKDTIFNFIEDAENMIVPMNLEPIEYGQHYKVVDICGVKLCICNLMCEVFMHNVDESPFTCMSEVLEDAQADIYFVDLHGEATSEKTAFANVFKEDVQAVVGTHTHVQTADERIIGKCAFISDVGMCGAYDSIIGRDVEEVITRFLTNEKTRFTVAEGEGIFSAVLIDIDTKEKCATNIKRIQIRPEQNKG